MRMNLARRVEKMRLGPSARNSLTPLFEAVVNSIHAIDAGKPKIGKIDITIVRDPVQGVLTGGDGQRIDDPHVIGFEIVDNGIGFTDENYDSFDEADTAHKAKIGGQGVGRLLWLKTHALVKVESTFGKAKLQTRTFDFDLKSNGISSMQIVPAIATETGTRVRLISMLPEYKEVCHRKFHTLALHIVDHCVEFLAMPKAPTITLHDPTTGDKKSLNDLFNLELKIWSDSKKFRLKGQDFKLTHILMRKMHDATHQLKLCAHDRPARSEPLSDYLKNLPKTLTDEASGKAMVYNGYLSSKYLDKDVVPERNDFHKTQPGGLAFDGGITWNDIIERAVDEAKTVLDPHLAPVVKAKEEQIRTYVEGKAYQYRPLFVHRKDLIERIPPGLSEVALDLELYRLDQEYAVELKQRGYELLHKGDKKATTLAEHKEEVRQFLEEWNDRGKHQLAVYVGNRKAILSYLARHLRSGSKGEYSLEEDVHSIIFPLKTTSDDVPIDQMNLWIIDERMAFHRYLASDKYLDNIEPIESDAHLRPDILVFGKAFAFSDRTKDFGAITIVEFKRPMRDDYADSDNPIKQVLEYVDRIKQGTAKARDGRPMMLVNQNTPFYCYVVCDLTPKMRAFAMQAGLLPTPDNRGHFGYNTPYGAYVEVISFEKLVEDAQKRNQVFFEKLGLGRDLVEHPVVKPPFKNAGDVPSAPAMVVEGEGATPPSQPDQPSTPSQQ